MSGASEAGEQGGDAAMVRATNGTREGGPTRRPGVIAPPVELTPKAADRGEPSRGVRLAFPRRREAPVVGGREADAGGRLKTGTHSVVGSAHIFAAPVVPGKEEALRRFLQEVAEARTEYGRLRGRLGIRRELVWLVPWAQGYATVAYLELDGDLHKFFRRLASTEEAFDLWVKEEIVGCHGRIEQAKFPRGSALGPVFSWDESRGPS